MCLLSKRRVKQKFDSHMDLFAQRLCEVQTAAMHCQIIKQHKFYLQSIVRHLYFSVDFHIGLHTFLHRNMKNQSQTVHVVSERQAAQLQQCWLASLIILHQIYSGIAHKKAYITQGFMLSPQTRYRQLNIGHRWNNSPMFDTPPIPPKRPIYLRYRYICRALAPSIQP